MTAKFQYLTPRLENITFSFPLDDTITKTLEDPYKNPSNTYKTLKKHTKNEKNQR
jgi:hypothetical protein